jgi:hypothetical protein
VQLGLGENEKRPFLTNEIDKGWKICEDIKTMDQLLRLGTTKLRAPSHSLEDDQNSSVFPFAIPELSQED